MNIANYGRPSYVQRVQEYPTSQQIAGVAFFYEHEAILVPNARWPTSNVVVLTEHVRPSQMKALDSEPVDLRAWFEKAHAAK